MELSNNRIVSPDGEPEKLKQKVKLGKNPNKSPQAPRYASKEAIERAKTLDDVF